MIIQARSPLFIFHVLASVTAAGSLGAWAEIHSGRESFLSRPEFGLITQMVIAGFVVSSVALLILATMEFAILKGWDPKFLRVRLYGAEVLRVSQPQGEEEHWVLTVRHPDGEEHTYQAEENEAQPIRVGDQLRLDVFGQHVVEVRRLASGAPSAQAQNLQTVAITTRTTTVGDRRSKLKTWLFMALLFPGGGAFIGMNLLPLIYREDVAYFSGGRRSGSWEHLFAQEAIWANAPLVAAGLAVVIFGVRSWLVGWDQAELEYAAIEFQQEWADARRTRPGA